MRRLPGEGDRGSVTEEGEMTEGKSKRVLYEVDGKVVADIRSAEELVDRIELFPGWIVVEKVQLSETSRGGIIMPNADAKDQQHLMLFKVSASGPPKEVDPGRVRPLFAKVGDIVILKPAVAQFLVNQNHQFGVIADVDIIGRVHLDVEKFEGSTEPVSVPEDRPEGY